MRYALGLLASLLLCSPAHAASLLFEFDVLFRSVDGFPDIGLGGQMGRGQFTLDNGLLVGLGSEILPREASRDFSFAVPFPGTSILGAQQLENLGGVCRRGPCTLQFTNGLFTGFGGTLTDRNVLLFFEGNTVTAADGFVLFAPGQIVGTRFSRADPVPEPSSWAMIGVCGLLVGWEVRRRTVSARRTALEA